MDKKEQILRYDIASLKTDIARLRNDIKVFSGIIRKAKVYNDEANIKVFSDAIVKAEGEIAELKGYIKLIEENGNGDSV